MGQDKSSLTGLLLTAALTHTVVKYPAVYWAVLILLFPVWAVSTWYLLAEDGFLPVIGWILLVGGVWRYGGGLVQLTISLCRGIARLFKGNALAKFIAVGIVIAISYGAFMLATDFAPTYWPAIAAQLGFGEAPRVKAFQTPPKGRDPATASVATPAASAHNDVSAIPPPNVRERENPKALPTNWRGTMACGELQNAPSAPQRNAFTGQVFLHVANGVAVMDRQWATGQERMEGRLTDDRVLQLEGSGFFFGKEGSAWRTRATIQLAGERYEGTAIIESQDGTRKYRDCTIMLASAVN